MQALARVENEDPRVNPNPWASVVCLIVSYGGAQDDDVFEYTLPRKGPSSKSNTKTLSTPCLPTYDRRMCRSRQEVVIRLLGRITILDIELGVAYQVNVDVHKAGLVGLLLNLDGGHPFAYSAPAAVMLVMNGGPEVKPEANVCQGHVFRRR